ncbi:MAG: Trk system potassium transporter TrkA [Planctomycetota bacterium]
MHIVIVSSGQIALQFAAELCGEHDVAVVHEGDEGRSTLEKLDVDLIDGAGNDPEVLTRAKTSKADYLIACCRSDEMNIMACVTARKLGKARTVCFVSKEEYVRTFSAESGDGREGAPEFGIDHLVWPSQMLADKIEKILAVPGATDVGQFAHGQVSMLEYKLRPGVPIVDRPLAEIRSFPAGVLLAAVTRGDEWFVPRGHSILAEGDRVLFIGRTAAMRELAAWFAKHLEEDSYGDIVVVGGGTVGYLLASQLENTPSARTKIIDIDSHRCRRIAQTLERTLVLVGDGSDIDLLESERVREARALVAVTDSDEKNLLCSLLARQLGVPKVITRVTTAANRRLFERVGIDVPISARGAATEAVLHMIRHGKLDLLASLGGGRGDMLEITLPNEFEPKPLKEIEMPPDSLVATLLRKREVLVPGGATLLGPGDHCLVICNAERVEEVRRTFGL